jgi:hypothetical protein
MRLGSGREGLEFCFFGRELKENKKQRVNGLRCLAYEGSDFAPSTLSGSVMLRILCLCVVSVSVSACVKSGLWLLPFEMITSERKISYLGIAPILPITLSQRVKTLNLLVFFFP